MTGAALMQYAPSISPASTKHVMVSGARIASGCWQHSPANAALVRFVSGMLPLLPGQQVNYQLPRLSLHRQVS